MMKRENFIQNSSKFILSIFAFLVILAASCDDPIDPIDTPSQSGIYILNEGNFNMNNSSLSFYDFKTGNVIQDYFLQQNNRGLGDVANDLKVFGSKLYCVVNNSEQLEVLSLATAKTIKRISFVGKQPRNIEFFQNKAYVTCFDGSVVRIDTNTLIIDGTATAGSNPEGICFSNNKMYVANSGGLDYPMTSNTISVINPITMSLIKTIPVAIGPRIIKSDSYGDVYVACTGNYGDISPSFHRIDSQIDEVVQNFNLPVQNFTISGTNAYLYSYDYNDNSKWFKVLDVITENIVKENFITDGTQITIPYGIAVDPLTHDVYITDAVDFTSTGDVYCFNPNGVKKFQFEAGINPSGSFVFKR